MIGIIKLDTGKLAVGVEEFRMGEAEAVEIAARIAYASGCNLVKSMEKGKIVEWNLESEFFRAYRKLMEEL